jgi:hypothetical protein
MLDQMPAQPDAAEAAMRDQMRQFVATVKSAT